MSLFDRIKTGAELRAQDIRKALKEHGHEDMVVGAGAAMTLRGLRPHTDDIDVSVPSGVFDTIHRKYGNPPLKELRKNVHLFTIPGTRIDVHRSDNLVGASGRMPEVNANVQTPGSLLKFYRKMDRPKDQPWIKRLEKSVKSASLFDRIKKAATRWSEEMAAGNIKPKDEARLRMAEGLGLRQTGKTPLGRGSEKIVYPAFGGGGQGRMVSKRIHTKFVDDPLKLQMQASEALPSLINEPVPHGDLGGWSEPRLMNLPKSDFLTDRVADEQRIDDLGPDRKAELEGKVRQAGGKSLGERRAGPGVRPSAAIELPGGKIEAHDLRAENMGLQFPGGIPDEKNPHLGQLKIRDPLLLRKGESLSGKPEMVGPAALRDTPIDELRRRGMAKDMKRVRKIDVPLQKAVPAGGFTTAPTKPAIKPTVVRRGLPKNPMAPKTPYKPMLRRTLPGH